MIILNQNNSKKIYGNKYLYNLVCNKNTNIKKLVIKSNIKKNIIFGFIGKENTYILNPEYSENSTIIELDITLLNGNNYIFIYTSSIDFEIIINENITLGDIKYKIFNSPYIINKSNYYDLRINKNKLYFLAYINDISNNNSYEIKINNNKINTYEKYDNFYNFLGNINIQEDKIYTIQINMKKLIPIIKFIIIYDNVIENKTNYDNKLNNMYNMNPMISYKDIEFNTYYIEIKFEKYNDYTRLSFDKNNTIVFKIINNILFINDKKIFIYNNQYLKFLFNYNYISNSTEIYLFNNISYKKHWEQILIINNKINFYQKLYESKYYDSHFNKKIIIFRKAYIFNCTKENKYLDNIDFKYYDNEPLNFINNYKLILGGDINKNSVILNKNIQLNIINNNNPISINTIDSTGNKLIKECFNNSSKNNILDNNTKLLKNNILDNNVKLLKNNILDNNTINQQFMFNFTNKTLYKLFKALLIITILILIKIYNK